ncbi:hypothetical protein [Ilumatobacter sp.]|uniref:hypothetical protein n=1 Tax=Ilumatobacter sp. TaxID=1967498 RepID=UPI003751FFF3
MSDNDDAARIRQTLDQLTASAVPAPPMEALLNAERPRKSHALMFIAAALVVLSVSFGGLLLLQPGGRSDGESDATCGEAVAIDGRIYFRDGYNTDAVDASDLGAVIDRVDQAWPCNDTGDDQEVPTDGVVASALPPGTELRAIGSEPSDVRVAAVNGDEVRVYVSPTGDRFAFSADVFEIRINSGFDGSTGLATIDDPTLVRQLVNDLRVAPTAPRANDETDLDDEQVTVELVRSDGLRTVVPYWIDEDQLADRRVGDSWATAVNDALASGPPQPIADGITMIGAKGVARFHPNGACRRDRPDLEVQQGEVLSIALTDGTEISHLYVSPRPPTNSGETPPDPSYLSEPGQTFIAPELVGTTVVEAGLSQSADVCTVLLVTEAR